MEPIDAAALQLETIIGEVRGYAEGLLSEQDTRLKVINRLLTEVLGWPLSEIFTEESTGDGFIDYKLTVNGLARLVVEAKRDDRTLGTEGRTSGRAYKLNGPVFNTASVKEGVAQAIRYCGQKNAELACVTNGREWIAFRGSRLGDGRDTMDGMAFVFPSLDDTLTNFKIFYDLLSYDAVTQFRYRAYFQEAEGRPIRNQSFRMALRSPSSRRLLTHNKLSNDIDRVMTSFFRRLSGDGDPELLVRCFVVTKESQVADERLARISEDLAGRIRNLDTASAEQLTELVERVHSTQRNEFVIMVGTKGAGKSTFIDRFFRHVLPKPLVEQCIVARVNLADSEGDEKAITTWLDRHLLEALESAVFHDAPPTYEELQGMFFDEYQRWRDGTLHHLYERDKETFKIDFGKHIEKRREERPNEYIQRLVKHIVRSRRKVPCIVFDNADHFNIEFQERVFQYARSIYEQEICLIILPITDRTSWQLSREGALRSFESESLFLPTPAPKAVLMKRIEFLETKIAEEKRVSGQGYFFGRGISLSIDNLLAFTSTLQAVFLRTGEVSDWISYLANRDIRQCLEIARHIVTSPHLEVHELISAYIANSNIYVPSYKIKKALIKGQYDIYPADINLFVRNIYSLDDEIETSPLLGLRILRMLRDVQKADGNDPFVTLEQIIDYFRAMMVDTSVTMNWLNWLLEVGLCLSYDPTVTSAMNAGKIELAPSGFQHLRWGTRDSDYIQAMMEVTPLVDRVIFDQLSVLARQPQRDVWHRQLELFIDYLIAEDTKFCSIPDHEAYLTQTQIAPELRRVTTYPR
jgi:AAA domain